MQATIRFRTPNVHPILRTLERKRATLESELRVLFEQHGLAMEEQASELSPFDTGFMSSHVTYTPLSEMIGFTVGWHETDFAAAGLDPYYIYQEFGTIHTPAQPTLGPVGRQGLPALERDVRRLLKTFGGL